MYLTATYMMLHIIFPVLVSLLHAIATLYVVNGVFRENILNFIGTLKYYLPLFTHETFVKINSNILPNRRPKF